ncbi:MULTISPECIES: hypothetical protein [unclassified Bradyrhizobium]|uniref:hypothetical protein n=1 Tax=unclassified Bradyrhizobium TaxID=2631580 RepID=UPI0004077F69|nr:MULTISPECIES: hypothetical protein [unclassified Bradyrhizobium]MCP3466320.1 hypothetical protein [Bradyrhizobium sp. CCGUVB23]
MRIGTGELAGAASPPAEHVPDDGQCRGQKHGHDEAVNEAVHCGLTQAGSDAGGLAAEKALG